ncbi:MAG: ATP-binding cassette domain-containing protein [Candidatus Moranbacteria bacterium]|nr:ATP-binding cassette domain-containing protein [Candidatus Moranbacteria bacterium]
MTKKNFKNSLSKKNKNPAIIIASNLSKGFKIPHQKLDTLRSSFVNFFNKKSYEHFKALNNVSFKVKKGEFFGIIGRNGSGKSTLLKILAGIYTPDQGKVEVRGGISPFLELGVGFNPQLTGRENVYLNATMLGMSQDQIDEKFHSILRFSEIKRFIDQKLKNYSSGMKVRLAFSVAIHANKEILLMDEVLAVGDNNFQQKCIEEFVKYKEAGKTVVLVAHGLENIRRYCDRVMLLRNGKVVKKGKAEDVVNHYINQNISDEEKRLVSEEQAVVKNKQKVKSEKQKKATKASEPTPKKHIKKSAKIQKVEFLDSNQNNKKTFKTGSNLTIRIYFRIAKKLKNPLIGIAIYHDRDKIIYGTNNEKRGSGITRVEKEKGYIDFFFKKISLLEGQYHLSVAIASFTEKMIDRKDREYSFKIFNGYLKDYGVCNLHPEVEFNYQ